MCKEIGGEDFPQVRQCAAFPHLNSKTQLSRSITLRNVRVTRTGFLIIHVVRLANCRTGSISSREREMAKKYWVLTQLDTASVDRIVAESRINGDALDRQGLSGWQHKVEARS